MRNMCLGITAFVVTVGIVSVGAQGRNFSGTWVIDSEKTMAAAQAAGGEQRVVLQGGGAARGTRSTATGEVTSAGGGGSATGTRVARSGGSGTGEATAGARGGVAVGGTVSAAGGGGAAGTGEVRAVRGGGAGVSTDMVIAIDVNTFSTNIGGVHTSYPLDGSEVTVQTRGGDAKARASWKGDMLVIETISNGPDGPVTSTTSWFLEGDSLVRLTTRRTYYKKK
jgi:hypothetical protein